MIDRYGKKIRVGLADHVIIWIEAANTLPNAERSEAFKDIADMTGHSVSAVRYHAKAMREREKKHLAIAMRKRSERDWYANLGPSSLRAPTIQELMAGRAP